MRNRALHAMALAVTFTVSAAISFAANGAGVPYDKYDQGAYSQPATVPWDGGYLGLLLGYGNADTSLGAVTGNFDFSADGVVGGGLVGHNWQSGTFVVGLEADLLASDMTASQGFGANTVDATVDWVGGLRGRAGFLLSPELLVFASLGYGWANIDLPVAGPGGAAMSETFGGFQFGGGMEVKLPGNWGARFDYLYTDPDEETILYPGAGAVTYDPDVHQLRGGLTYKF